MGEKISIRISQIQDGGVTILRKFFSKFYIFLNDSFPQLISDKLKARDASASKKNPIEIEGIIVSTVFFLIFSWICWGTRSKQLKCVVHQ